MKRSGNIWLLAALLVLQLSFANRGYVATTPASLVADSVGYDRETRTLTATGAVEIYFRGRILRASRIIFDEVAREIRAFGPISLVDPDGLVMLADGAALTPELTDGLIEGARLLIEGQMQLAAAEVRRVDGRYISLYRTVASSCRVCPDDPAPTWAIRAARVTQDQQAQQIYFRNATLEVYGLPVFWLPYLRIPDPSLTRASGFLVPKFLNSDLYGFGLKLPYYWAISPSADATLTPFLTTGGGRLFEGEYRRRFRHGGFDLSGVLALEDGLENEDLRGTVRAVGAFALGRGFVGEFDLAAVSDDRFLRQFDYSDSDRLTSIARIRRTRETEHIEMSMLAFQSLRPDEQEATIPFVLPDLHYRRYWDEPRLGGRASVDLNALGVMREEERDVLRFGGGADFHRQWFAARGILVSTSIAADLDLYRSSNDPLLKDDVVYRFSPNATLELRWPLARLIDSASHVIEPIVQIVYSETFGDDAIPNEDSLLPEFDETNLFSLSRFPGRDRIETGLRANVGVSYTRFDPSGWNIGLTVGRVFRAEVDDQFPDGTGLAGRSSAYVGAIMADFGFDLSMFNRTVIDGDLSFRRNEFGLTYLTQKGELSITHIFLAEDDTNPFLGPQPESSEVALDAAYRLASGWKMRGDWRYDIATGNSVRAGGGLTYGNECAEFDLSVSRRFTSSSNVPPTTSFGFSVRLAGLGGSGSDDWPERSCGG